jgi:predicted phage-related endonuclease
MMEERQPGFCAKNGYEIPEPIEGSQLEWGKAFESAIVELAEQKAGKKINERERLFTDEYSGSITESDIKQLDPIVTCHIDGWYGSNESEPLHEGKTTSLFYFKDNFGEPGTDAVPVEYQAQCQHQMSCTGADEVILSVLVFPRRVDDWVEMGWKPEQDVLKTEYVLSKYNENGKPIYANTPTKWARLLNDMGYFHQYHIKRNDELIKNMLEKYHEWWHDHIIKEKPPEPVSTDDIKKLFREPIGTIVATEQIERWHDEIKQCNDEISQLKKRAEQIKKLNLEFLKEMSEKKKYVIDDDSQEKIILLNGQGKKLHSYGKNKNGVLVFR